MLGPRLSICQPRRITIFCSFPPVSVSPQDRCKLYCQVESNQYYMLAEKVIDGTPCGRDTFHICVNGHCKPAGCDHVLNSTVELDICGVCGGDNSTCQWITGSYNSTQYGYTRVAKIPAGSNNIDIRQHAWKDMVDDSNYLGTWFLHSFQFSDERDPLYFGRTFTHVGSKSKQKLFIISCENCLR